MEKDRSIAFTSPSAKGVGCKFVQRSFINLLASGFWRFLPVFFLLFLFCSRWCCFAGSLCKCELEASPVTDPTNSHPGSSFSAEIFLYSIYPFFVLVLWRCTIWLTLCLFFFCFEEQRLGLLRITSFDMHLFSLLLCSFFLYILLR